MRVSPFACNGVFFSIACSLGAESEDFSIGKNAGRLLGGIEDASDQRVVRRDMMLLQPEQHIGLAAQRADLNHLVEAEKMRRHAAIDGIGEFEIILAKSFDERGGVHASGGAEGVMADDWIVRRNGCMRGTGNFFAILLQA